MTLLHSAILGLRQPGTVAEQQVERLRQSVNIDAPAAARQGFRLTEDFPS